MQIEGFAKRQLKSKTTSLTQKDTNLNTKQ